MSDKKLTDEEIIKALECHFNEELDKEPFRCADCPLYNDTSPSCSETLRSYVLDLISRQKAEIEELKNYVNRCKSGEEYRVKCLLEKPNEAIKEFAERLKSYLLLNKKGSMSVVSFENIDNLLKEMVGEEE